ISPPRKRAAGRMPLPSGLSQNGSASRQAYRQFFIAVMHPYKKSRQPFYKELTGLNKPTNQLLLNTKVTIYS
ncbi:hypothetical protein CHU92_00505, partial [Flavobacterium cyanobacteriorum]